MRFSVLGSGSAGNSTVLDSGTTRILIDAGLSAKQLNDRLTSVGIDPVSLSAILLTHEHGDHTRGLQNFIKKYPIPIYTTAETAHVLREQINPSANWRTFQAGQEFSIGDLTIESFSIQHDAVDPVGYVASSSGMRFGLLSDAGFITTNVRLRLQNLTALFVEANYDEELLELDTKRPWSIKQRISSRHGHLSNTQVSDLIRDIAHSNLSQIVFGHLSSDCNCPKKVLSLFSNIIRELNLPTSLHCATQSESTPWFPVSPPFRLV